MTHIPRKAGASVLALLLLACAAFGAEAQKPKISKKLWALSLVALTAANLLDTGSSMGRYEQNRLLRGPQGQFSPSRAAAFKIGAVSSLIVMQTLYARNHPELQTTGVVVNFIGAGALTAIAVRNRRIPQYLQDQRTLGLAGGGPVTAAAPRIAPVPAPAMTMIGTLGKSRSLQAH